MCDYLQFCLETNSNVCILGPGGTGKTYFLQTLANKLKQKNVLFGLTATTGIAACNLSCENISASTLHSWAGIGIGNESVEKYVAKVMSKKQLQKKWQTTEILIIDEVSMLGQKLFDKLSQIAQTLRQNDSYFGGIRLILCGDFYQLPPVNDNWIFESPNFDQNFKFLFFTEPKRYSDLQHFEMLNEIRKGICNSKVFRLLKSRQKVYDVYTQMYSNCKSKDLIRPTILYSRKADVENYNLTELEKLDSPDFYFSANDTFTGVNQMSFETQMNTSIPETLRFRIGAQVMLKANLDIENGLCNGSRGVILNIVQESDFECITVKFVNGITETITRYTWVLENKTSKFTRTQFPLILAYALTIHKCQGCTLDFVVCDLGYSVFENGQAYVALSRVRSIQGLFLSSFVRESIFADPKVKNFMEKLGKHV